MKWILVLHLITGGKNVEMKSAGHDTYADCEQSREAWIRIGHDVKVVSSECVQAKQ